MRRLTAASLMVALAAYPAGLRAATPSTVTSLPSPPGVTVAGGAAPVVLDLSDIMKLPAVTVAVSFNTAHGTFHGSFQGPLLWTILGAAHLGNGHFMPRQVVVVTGSDGYSAVLAMGEIAPLLEAKQVVLGTTLNGKPLGLQHLRLVVPGDRTGARSVRDVARIAVTTP